MSGGLAVRKRPIMDFAHMPPPAFIVAAALATIVALAAVKLLWGMALWTKKSDFRLGDRFGGETGEVVEWTGRAGTVRAGGELWQASSADALIPGDRVKVVAKGSGLVLEVKKILAP